MMTILKAMTKISCQEHSQVFGTGGFEYFSQMFSSFTYSFIFELKMVQGLKYHRSELPAILADQPA